MKPMTPSMTPAHIAKLRNDVKSFIASRSSLPTFEEIEEHVNELGWRNASSRLFREWLEREGFLP